MNWSSMRSQACGVEGTEYRVWTEEDQNGKRIWRASASPRPHKDTYVSSPCRTDLTAIAWCEQREAAVVRECGRNAKPKVVVASRELQFQPCEECVRQVLQDRVSAERDAVWLKKERDNAHAELNAVYGRYHDACNYIHELRGVISELRATIKGLREELEGRKR